MIWLDGAPPGWACDRCNWRFPAPFSLDDDEAKGAYKRFATVNFRSHKCQAETDIAKSRAPGFNQENDFAGRARMLIMRGYKPKDAVEAVMRELTAECNNDGQALKKLRAEAEQFMLKIQQGRL